MRNSTANKGEIEGIIMSEREELDKLQKKVSMLNIEHQDMLRKLIIFNSELAEQSRKICTLYEEINNKLDGD